MPDCEAIAAAVEQAGVLLTVGFNRRFSPYAQALKAALPADAPRVILYRVNAGLLPLNHWATDPEEGGGRILGEGVHFYDFCAWLAGSDPVSIHAERIGSGKAQILAEDNVSAVLRFANGSTATIVYTSLGHAALGKERIEVFASGGAAVLEDYRSLTRHGLRGTATKNGTEDKGQFGILENFIHAIQGKAPLGVTAADGLRATRIAAEVLRQAQGEE